MLLLLLACTFTPGTAFGRLDGATAELRFEPGEARDLGDRTVLTDQVQELRVERLALQVEAIELQELGGAAADFDPADPPEGYGLCHGGHCHAEDGSLVSYEEIIAELSGGAPVFEAIIAAPVDAEVDLWAGGPGELGLDGLLLPRADIRRLEIRAARYLGEGEERTSGARVAWDLTLPASFAASVELPIDRDEPEGLTVQIELRLDGRLFDGVDFSALDGVLIDDAAQGAGLRLAENALANLPTLSHQRSD